MPAYLRSRTDESRRRTFAVDADTPRCHALAAMSAKTADSCLSYRKKTLCIQTWNRPRLLYGSVHHKAVERLFVPSTPVSSMRARVAKISTSTHAHSKGISRCCGADRAQDGLLVPVVRKADGNEHTGLQDRHQPRPLAKQGPTPNTNPNAVQRHVKMVFKPGRKN